MKPKCVIYTGVSTADQTVENQKRDPAGIDCSRRRKGFDVAEALKLHGPGWAVRRIGKKPGVSCGTVQSRVLLNLVRERRYNGRGVRVGTNRVRC